MKLPKIDWSALKPAKIARGFQTRAFRAGGYSIVITLIALALAVAINYFVSVLPTSWTHFDITSNHLLSLSQQTQEIVEGLETDVQIYWVVQSGQEDATLKGMLEKYSGMNKHVQVTQKDPDIYPTFVSSYTTEEIYNNSLIVESGNRSRYISYNDIYVMDYLSYYYYGTEEWSFCGETELTGAISYVTSSTLPKVYTLTGHGEAGLPSTFSTGVEQQNMELIDLSLLTVDAVPEDADCVLILAPQSDISAQEKEMLQTYMGNGGNVYLILDPAANGVRLSNLESLLEDYGIRSQEGIVVEADQNHYAWSTPLCLLPNMTSHTVTKPLLDGGYYVVLPVARGFTVAEELPENISVSQLLTTSDSAFSKLAGYEITTYEREEGDVDGPFCLSAAVTATTESGEQAHMIVVGASALVNEDYNAQISGGNLDFFINSLSWMCGKEDSISIHAKDLTTEYLTMNKGTASVLGVMMLGVIPVAYLVVGIMVWARRKRK